MEEAYEEEEMLADEGYYPEGEGNYNLLVLMKNMLYNHTNLT